MRVKIVGWIAYNHLGNNDGKNLSAPAQFRSKEISKASVVDDMVHVSFPPLSLFRTVPNPTCSHSQSNSLLYKPITPAKDQVLQVGDKVQTTETPDHLVVIKYMPSVGDDKRAIDEYYSEIGMGGRNTMVRFLFFLSSLSAPPRAYLPCSLYYNRASSTSAKILSSPLLSLSTCVSLLNSSPESRTRPRTKRSLKTCIPF